MKTNLKPLTIIAFLGILLHSCSNDDENPALTAPKISNFEYGQGSAHSDDRVAYRGSDIHLEAEILAEATVSSITVSIHAHDLTAGEGEVEWDFEQTYIDAGYLVINPTFHEHIDIPSNVATGEYHIVLTVTDASGNSTESEGHLQILAPISLSGVSISESVVRGSDFHTEFTINAVHGIHQINVDIHAHGLTPGTGELEWNFENNYSEGYHGQTEVEFHEHIDVPDTSPAGEYHIVFTVEDEEGNTLEYESHIDVSAS